MTGVPEVTLAAEAGLRYAAISLVVNPASGVGDSTEPITMDEIDAVLAAAPRRCSPSSTSWSTPAPPSPTPTTTRPGMTQGPHRERPYVVTVDDDDRVLTDTTVVIDNGVITEIGAAATASAAADAEATESSSTPAASC